MDNGIDSANPLEEDPGGKGFINSVNELSRHLSLSRQRLSSLEEVVKAYRIKIPDYYFSLVDRALGDRDPIGRQCLPSPDELSRQSFENRDPLGEEKDSPFSCLVHRYPDRVLLLVTSNCFMYCRHCTRKRIWNKKINEPYYEEIDKAINYLGANPAIREVIVSGGDPLTLSTQRLDDILSKIYSRKNIKVIRIGTRAPVVFPRRIDDRLCQMLKKYDNIWINVQFNHPREITPQSASACRSLQRMGIPLSNQSVLLKGVNDDVGVMRKLCQKLQEIRVRPYYLFQCDPVNGTDHFRTSPWQGREIIRKMQGFTSGMCIPVFVIDGINGKGKIPFGPDYLVSRTNEGVMLKNYRGESFFYQDGSVQPKVSADRRKSNRIKRIAIAFNLKKGSGEGCEEYDDFETVESLKKEIESCGFEVIFIEQDENFLKNLLDRRPDFVFNIAEGRGNLRGRESQVPAVLESVGIPYSGSDPVALGVTLDKYLANHLLSSASIPVPRMIMIDNIENAETFGDIFRQQELFVVKPRWEGSSKGIFLNSLVTGPDGLKAKVRDIILKYRQPALIEEFLAGDEITVGVYGNKFPRILGMMKIAPQDANCRNFVYSFEVKQDWQNRVRYEPQETIAGPVQRLITVYAIKAYKELGLRDMVRIDFRLTLKNQPKIIDINPLPGLSPHNGDLPILYKLRGYSYNKLIELILEDSFNRYGFDWKKDRCVNFVS